MKMNIGKLYKVKSNKYYYYENNYNNSQFEFNLTLSRKDLIIILEAIISKENEKNVSFKILIDGKIMYINGVNLGGRKIFDLLTEDFDAIVE